MERGRHDAARASASRQPASLQIECDACVQADRVSRRATYLRAARGLAPAEVGQGLAFT